MKGNQEHLKSKISRPITSLGSLRELFKKTLRTVLGKKKTYEIEQNQLALLSFVKGKKIMHLAYKEGNGIVGCYFLTDKQIIEAKDFVDCCCLILTSTAGKGGIIVHISPKILGPTKGNSDLIVEVKQKNYLPFLQEGLGCMTGEISRQNIQKFGDIEIPTSITRLGDKTRNNKTFDFSKHQELYDTCAITLIGGDTELVGYLKEDLSKRFNNITYVLLGTTQKDIWVGEDKAYVLINGGEQLEKISI